MGNIGHLHAQCGGGTLSLLWTMSYESRMQIRKCHGINGLGEMCYRRRYKRSEGGGSLPPYHPPRAERL